MLVCEGGRPSAWNVVGGAWRFIDTTGEESLPGEFQDARSFEDGVATVRDDVGWRAIDARGETLFTLGQADELRPFRGECALVTYGRGSKKKRVRKKKRQLRGE